MMVLLINQSSIEVPLTHSLHILYLDLNQTLFCDIHFKQTYNMAGQTLQSIDLKYKKNK